MAWLAVELMVDAARVSAVSDALVEEGALSIDVADAQAGTERETPIFGEPGQDLEVAFGSNRLIALFSPETDLPAVIERAMAAAGLSITADYKITEVPEQDWVRLTQSQFDPIRVSSRLWIVPSWHASPDPAAINIVLDPGLAFGTGSHPTTRLCLDWLDRYMSPGNSVIDYGCGSGILAIAAAKLGAARVRGVDIDEQAVLSSRYNAQRNNVVAEFSNADDVPPEPADVVLANILSNPLKVLAPLLARLTVHGGKLVLSGILTPQAEDVADTYRAWFAVEPPVTDDGWVRLTGTRLN
ncbi:MAG TPA: 50S ribosomal protein L11 methyltransferase [Burkholderiales bacterium]